MLLVNNAHLDQGKTFLFLRRCKILLFFSIGFLLFWVFLVIPFQKRKSIIISIEYGTFESINTPPVIATTTLEDVVASENAVSRGMNKNEIERSFSSSQERLSRYSLFHPNTHGAPESANAWYQNNVEPAITCSHEERIGAAGEGGKWMCDLDALRDKKDCLIYSIGSNNDFSWESAVKARVPNCEIHVFDHTVRNATNKPENVFFHKWGLTAEKVPNANPNLRSLSEISNALGHKDKRVDVFKIDCEGCEWDTHTTWFNSDLQIEEILVETHHGTANPSPNSRAKQFFTHLHESGYRIFHKEPNVHYSGGSGLCVEFGFRRI